MIQTGHSVGVAFALNIAAGIATILGGMVVLNRHLVHLANPRSLAIALSISAGVMMFISLVEIYGESVHLLTEGFKTDEMSEETATGHGWLAATACFAVGIALIYAIDVVVHKISPVHEMTEIDNLNSNRESLELSKDNESFHALERDPRHPTRTMSRWIPKRSLHYNAWVYSVLWRLVFTTYQKALLRTSVLYKKTSVGLSLAVGIGLHNIPEAIAVAAPIYFATGSRWRGIMWCTISACAEPMGGVIAWLAIGDGMDPISEGILFGIVCGIMVCICVKELIPAAYKLAKDENHIVAFGMLAGMFIMVSSLTLFGYAGV